MSDTPRIYVACLASYNAGKLHGEWIDCDRSSDEIRATIAEMLAQSPEHGAEEWAIHDFENWGFQLGESEDVDQLAEWAELLAEHGQAFAAYLDHVGRDASADGFVDAFTGEWESLAAYVENYWEECGEWKESDSWWHPSRYVDWDRMAHDLELSGDVFTAPSDGGVFIFNNC